MIPVSNDDINSLDNLVEVDIGTNITAEIVFFIASTVVLLQALLAFGRETVVLPKVHDVLGLGGVHKSRCVFGKEELRPVGRFNLSVSERFGFLSNDDDGLESSVCMLCAVDRVTHFVFSQWYVDSQAVSSSVLDGRLQSLRGVFLPARIGAERRHRHVDDAEVFIAVSEVREGVRILRR